MKRRHFLEATGLGAGALILPSGARFWNGSLTAIPSADKKALATRDWRPPGRPAPPTPTSGSAATSTSRCPPGSGGSRGSATASPSGWGAGDRGRHLGFAATPTSLRRAWPAPPPGRWPSQGQRQLQTEPVRLAPVPAYGAVSWKSPIQKNAMEILVQEKVDLLLAVNAAAAAGARFVNSAISVVNEQKYFASTDGTYADQDVHRIWPTFTVTATDPATGRFQTRTRSRRPSASGGSISRRAPDGPDRPRCMACATTWWRMPPCRSPGPENSPPARWKPDAGTW